MTSFRQDLVRTVTLASVLAVWIALIWEWPKYLFFQSDTFWLIETGRYIAEHFTLPSVDIYSFTKAGSPWFVYQSLFELALAGLFRAGGWLGISLFATIFLAWFCFGTIWRRTIDQGSDPLIAALVIGLAVVAMMPDLVSIRPQLLTFFFLWQVQQLLEDAWQNEENQSFQQISRLPVIMVVWANVHLSFVLELVLLAVYTACAYLRSIIGRARPGRKLWQPLAVVSVVCLASALLNPHGAGLFQFLLWSWTDHNITPELRPIDWSGRQPLLLFVCLAIMPIFGLIRRSSAPRLITSLIFLIAGLSVSRFMLYFVFLAIPISSLFLTTVCRKVLLRAPVSLASTAVSKAVFSRAYLPLLLAAAGAITACRPTVFPSTIPVSAANYFFVHGLAGRLFCNENAGSYLIFRFRGAVPVFIDTRADVYGREFCERYRRAMLYGEGWQDLMNSYKVTLALVPNKYRLADALKKASEWQVIYFDGAYTIFQRGSPKLELD